MGTYGLKRVASGLVFFAILVLFFHAPGISIGSEQLLLAQSDQNTQK
jgi:hypothetical protein